MSGGVGGLKLDPITGGVIQGGTTTTVSNTQTTGNGVGGTSGEVPDGSTPTFTSVLSSLRTMMPDLKSGDFETLLASITASLKDSMGDVQESRTVNEMEVKQVAIKENQAKIEEAARKMDEAEAKKKSGNIFDIIKLAFEALASAFMIALGAVLNAIPFCQGLGTMLIVAGVMLAISTINNIVAKANDGAGILGSIAKAAGASPDAIAAADGAFAAAMVVAAIACCFLPGGQGGAVANITNALSKMVQATVTAVSSGLQVGSAGFKMAAAVDSKEAKENRAESNELQALMQMLDDLIDQAMQLLMQVKGNANAMMQSMTDMLTDTGNTLSNTRFSG